MDLMTRFNNLKKAADEARLKLTKIDVEIEHTEAEITTKQKALEPHNITEEALVQHLTNEETDLEEEAVALEETLK